MPQRYSGLLVLTNFESGVSYYHRNDERALFEWLKRIPCVKSYHGDGRYGLVVRLKRRPGKDDLLQFLALCHRYGADMKQFAKFETAKNRDWFRNPKNYFHRAVFGKGRRFMPRRVRDTRDELACQTM
jgi:hypothetical protein